MPIPPPTDDPDLELELVLDPSDFSGPRAFDRPVVDPDDFDRINFEEPEPPIAPLADYRSAWSELDAAALFRGDLDEPEPVYLERQDGACLLYRAKVSSIAGEPESGKGWFALAAAIDVMRQSEHIVYVDFEDSPQSVFGRLKSLGVSPGMAIEKFHYIRPDVKLSIGQSGTWTDFLTVLKRAADAEGGLGLIVFDGITEALAQQAILSKDNDAVSLWFGEVPRRLAHTTKASVLLIDHVTKAEDSRGRYAIGAGAKLAAVDGSQFIIEMKMAFARGRSGLARIFVAKDRPGHVRANATGNGHKQPIADMVITAKSTGEVAVTMVPPDLQINEDGSAKPTNIQASIVKYLRRVKGGRGRQHILDSIPGRTATKRAAFNEMVDQGWIVEAKEGRKSVFVLGTPKDEADAVPD